MKKLLLFLSIGIVLIAIPATVYLTGKNQEVRKKAAPASTLTLTPTTLTKKVGETFTLEAKLDTATNQVGVVQIRIVYDPTKLQAQDITNGPLAPSITVSGKIDPTGKASITVGAKNNTQPITGSGTVAIITMKAIGPSASPVSVRYTPLPDTFANALGEGSNNVLIGITPANITILNADGSQAPAAVGGATVAPTITTTSAPSAMATYTPVPTPTSIPTSTIAPTLTLTPTIASQSSPATPAALTIDSINKNEEVLTTKPTFSGTAEPGSTITLTIYSQPYTVVVTADEEGNWTYTPQEDMETGPHTIVATASNPDTGQTQTTTVPFVISAGGSASESSMPVAGDIYTTIALLGIGVLFIIVGVFTPAIIR